MPGLRPSETPFTPPPGATQSPIFPGVWIMPDGTEALGQTGPAIDAFHNQAPKTDDAGRQFTLDLNGKPIYTRPGLFTPGGQTDDGGMVHKPETWNYQSGQWDKGGLDWGALGSILGGIGIGGSIAAPLLGGGAAAGGGASSATGGLSAGSSGVLAGLPGAGTALPGLAGGGAAATGGVLSGLPGAGTALPSVAGGGKSVGGFGDILKMLKAGGIDLTTLGLGLGSLFGGPNGPESFSGTGSSDPVHALQNVIGKGNGLFDKINNQPPANYQPKEYASPAPVSIPGLGFQIGGALGRDPAVPPVDPNAPQPVKRRIP